MKTWIRVLFPLVSCALAGQTVEAQVQDRLRAPGPGERSERVERRLVFGRGAKPAEKETVAFVGVETTPVPAVLTAQLGLQKGTGLIVRHVVEGSPASGVLQEHDVLMKLDDQILIDPRQFSVLVRNRNEGEEVELTYVRAGQQAKAKVKLGQQEVPRGMAFDFGGLAPGEFDVLVPAPEGAASGQEVRRTLSLLDDRRDGGQVMPLPPARPGFRALRMKPENSTMVYADESGTLEVTIKDGSRSLVAKDPKGNQLFSGPIDTPQEREAMPAEVREQLERIEGMRDFSFEIGEEFGGEEGAPRLWRRKISFPLRENASRAKEIPSKPAI